MQNELNIPVNIFEDKIKKGIEWGESLIRQFENINYVFDLHEFKANYFLWDLDICSLLESAFIELPNYNLRSYQMIDGKQNSLDIYRNDGLEQEYSALYDRLELKIKWLKNKLKNIDSFYYFSNLINHTQIDSKQIISSMSVLKKVFISHSVIDKSLAENVVGIIESMGIIHTQIFCSSVAGYGIEIGEEIFSSLKAEITPDTMVIFILTKNFYNSPICLCEMGAAWAIAGRLICVLAPEFDYKDMKGIVQYRHAFKIDERVKWSNLKDSVEKWFALPQEGSKSDRWEKKRNALIKAIKSNLSKSKRIS